MASLASLQAISDLAAVYLVVMDKLPTISVALAVFNGGEFLAEAIESILNQSYSDFEFLMIDDGSTDSSLQVMQDYAQKDQRIRLLSRENRGLVATLNELVGMARGTWIARMDADDISEPDRFARQLEWLDRTGADVCGSWVQRFGTSDNRLVRLHQSDDAIKTELLFYSPFAHPSVMFRASLAKQFPYDDTWIKAEDYDLWVRAAEAGWKMTNIPAALLRYRMHAGQVSTQASDFQQQQGHKIRRRYWRYVFASKDLDPNGMDACLQIFSSPEHDLDMDAVDTVFARLLSSSDGEAVDIIMSHVTRLYLLAAAFCPDIVARWSRLHGRYGVGSGLKTRLQLRFFRLFRIRKDSRLFRWLKMLQLWRLTW